MPREKRAAQFAPFDALSGMREALAMVEYEHEKTTMGEISEDTAERILMIITQLENDTIVKLRYFDDGYEKEYVGQITVNVYTKAVKLININQIINLDNLLDMDLM